MAGILDADTHIAEPPEMWDYLDPEWYARRPVVVSVPDDTLYGTSDHMWLIDGAIYPRIAGRGGNSLVTPTSQTRVKDRVDRKARELLDLPMRFEDMKVQGVDGQVVYPTLFLAYLTHDVAYEVALSKAYNRFMANVYAESEGIIRWVVGPPLRDIESTISEMRFGKAHGACGVFFRGIEGDRTLDDPYFFPVYEEAQALDLAITVHQGQGAPALNNLVDIKRSHTFTHGRMPPIVAFRNLVQNKVPLDFPTLRWGFIETGATWVPYAMYQLQGTMKADASYWGPKLFEENNMWISYEVGEDYDYLVRYIGEDKIVVGTDYGHHNPATNDRLASDPSAQTHMIATLRNSNIASSVVDRILTDNPNALYGVS
jgi:predicted TIM-barrel fold metal-dependent hydrolase